MMISSVLRLVKASGFWPDFETMEPESAYNMLTTGSEVMRMIRDGDPDSDDERARTIYGNLVTGNSP